MANNDLDSTQGTLWSETLIEVAIAAIRKKSPDQRLIEILKELRQKKLNDDYVIEKVRKELGDIGAARIQGLYMKVR